MASINLYKIDCTKIQLCMDDLEDSRLNVKKTKSLTKIVDDIECKFELTLYLEKPHQGSDGISWNWLLNEFEEQSFKTFVSPKAVLIIKNSNNKDEDVYAATFGSSYFRIDKFCDRDFGFKFASRMEYDNVKTTTLTAPNLKRNKTVNTYINNNELDFNSGESFSKLKVNVKLPEGFTIFKSSIEIGSSVHFKTDNNTLEGLVEIIKFIEKTLKIPDSEVKYKIPLFKLLKDDDLLLTLNEQLNEVLSETILGDVVIPLFSIPELEIIGSTEIFNHSDNEFMLGYPRVKEKKILNLTGEYTENFLHRK